MKKQGTINRPTSWVIFLLALAGTILLLSGIAFAIQPFSDKLVAVVLLVGGVLAIGLGSLRSGVLDLVYEQRLTRAALQDAASSNHASQTANQPTDA